MGVFATRSPFRPNPIGLSSVKLVGVVKSKKSKDKSSSLELVVSGADVLDGTPIYDIKPYLPYADSVPEASNGWSLSEKTAVLDVNFPEDLLEKIPEKKRNPLDKSALMC